MRKFLNMCLFVMLFGVMNANLVVAQETRLQIKGVVVDSSGEPLVGVTVVEEGTTNGTITDLYGQFVLSVKGKESVIAMSCIGYKDRQLVASSKELLRVVMEDDQMALDEVVVIGYGTVKKNDMTGSVVSVKADNTNRGAVTSPQEMLRGKVPGVNITSPSGAPGGGGEIRIRGGASLSANNNPLIVIDGVPVANDAAPGMPNGLAMINPDDIASFSVLKDASATAIYGSRASNGVILITTKKGEGDRPHISYNGSTSIKHNFKKMDMMSADQFKDYMTHVASSDMADKLGGLFGDANTDWQDEIYRVAVSTAHNVSLYGSAVKGKLPYRLSMGYNYDQGTVRETDNRSVTMDVNLSPKFLDNHLSVTLNAKGIYNKANYTGNDAIGSAVTFDPTHGPYRYNEEGLVDTSVENGFWNWASELTGVNPLTLLYDRWNGNRSYRAIGNVQLDYKVHGFEALSFNLNLGLDITSTKGDNGVNMNSVFANRDGDALFKGRGRYNKYTNLHRNQLLEFYMNFQKEWGVHNLNMMAGYSWSMNHNSGREWNYGRMAPADDSYLFDSKLISTKTPAARNALVSFYGRLNYSIASRYLFTATVRADGSSRFVGNNRWGVFPSAAFAWNIAQEKFLKDSKALSALKLRLGWGVTGQQEFAGIYDALSYAIISQDPTTQYPLGPDGLYYPVKPQPFNSNLKWEETTTYNVGLDFGFLNGRINGSLDAYIRKTDDLISRVNVPMGGNFSNAVYQNIGSMENKGVEFSLNVIPLQSEKWHMELGFNGTFQKTKIESLPTDVIEVGGSGSGTGNFLQLHKVGYTPYTFYLWQQAYDSNGTPIQNALVDRNGDGVINNSDRYMTNKSPNPDFYYGINFKLSYKNWDFGFNGHGAVGNYMFNDVMSGMVTTDYNDVFNKGYLINTHRSVPQYGFSGTSSTAQKMSDLFLEDASYFRMDDINLGYTFRNVSQRGMTIRLAVGVQNVFVITNYDGLDPESSVASGIDSNIYPRPRIYSVRLGINF